MSSVVTALGGQNEGPVEGPPPSFILGAVENKGPLGERNLDGCDDNYLR